MTMVPEAAAEIQNQLAFVCAVLGGFAIALAVGLLELPDGRKINTWATGFAITSAVAFLVGTVAGTFGVIWIAERPDLGRLPETPMPLLTAFRWSGQAFVLGVCLVLTSLALAGWSRSRALGWLASLASLFAAILIFYFLIFVVDVL